MTEREKEMLIYIMRFKQINGYSPTVSEMCRGLNTRSRTHVNNMMNSLKDQGYIKFMKNKPRTICIIKFLDDY